MTTTIHNIVLTPQGPVTVPCPVHLVSDGYHTYDELYQHINALFARLCIVNSPHLSWKSLAWKCSQTNDDVPSFLVGTEILPYGVVTRYLPMPLWERVNVKQVRNISGSWSSTNNTNIPRLLGQLMPPLKYPVVNLYDTLTTPEGTIHIPCSIGMVSNGFDTFNHLYELRHALFIAISNLSQGMAWRSLLHEDGTMFDNYFIAGIRLPEGMITYHLPIELWELLDVSELDMAPAWDGHTSSDVVYRLLKGLPLCQKHTETLEDSNNA